MRALTESERISRLGQYFGSAGARVESSREQRLI